VVKGIKKNENKKETNVELSDDDKTIRTDNKSAKSQESMDTLIDMSKVSM